ncbi:prepilin-type N-terminal cleavage/methylation domain-containing protein [Vibrio renipiscarius]|uniref:prepilin-type N-terminal cleavage/methylation domain-containing protein n=1 Tax=Vibrio renipiscarius TaxID=1461322 RepID=UPI003551ACCE
MKARNTLGFTLVELIVVIILLAIISVYAASRYIGVGSFTAFAIQDSVISIARQIQLNRMQSNSQTLTDDVILSISPTCFGSKASCDTPSDSRSDWVMEEGVRFSAKPNLNIIEFDLLGSPLGAASAGMAITVQGTNSQTQVSICPNGLISSSGCY